MIRSLRTPSAPDDAVVAVHDRPERLRASLDALADAGFHGRMLNVVAHRCPLQALAERRAAGDPPTRLQRVCASGLAWGLLWAVLAVVATTLPTAGPATVGAVLAIGAMGLVTQLAVVAARVAPESQAHARWQAPSDAHARYAQDLAADRALLVVEGSRSEVALARAILRERAEH